MKRTYLTTILIISMGFGSIETTTASGPLSLPRKNDGAYNLAIGLRAGETSGLTVKSYRANNTALEGIFGVWYNGFSFTGLYEINKSLDPKGLSFYYGIGGHFASGTNSVYYERDRYFLYRYRSYYPAFGVDGIVGLEFKVPEIPLAFSFDLKPMIELNTIGYSRFALDPGLGIKIVF